MPKPSRCKDSNCRTNVVRKGVDYCIICRAAKHLKFVPKYSARNYVFRGTYNNKELYNLVEHNNPFESYDILLSYCLSKIPKAYLRIILGVPEKEDIEYYLRDHWEHGTKTIRFGKHMIIWFRIYGKNYLFTPGQIKL